MKVLAKAYWGDEMPFEVPSEDILLERPAPLDLVSLEIDPPEWAIRATMKHGGRRHDKRRIDHGLSQTDWDRLNDGTNIGPEGPPRHLAWHPTSNGLPSVPNPDDEAAFNRSMNKRRRRQQSRARSEPAARKATPAGNLRNDDYRFWKGYADSSYFKDRAQCRWCGHFALSRQEMIEHHSGKKGEPVRWCKELLLALYKYAKFDTRPFCFNCKNVTQYSLWGVPLCNKPGCIARWKFNFPDHLVGYQHYREWASDDQAKNPTEGPFSHLPAGAAF